MKTNVAGKLIWSIALVVLWGCSPQQVSQNPSDYPPSLIVADRASEVAYARNRGSFQVSYLLDAAYPADGFIETIDRRLSEQGWRPLSVDFMNPDLPTSQVTGWQQHTDHGTRVPTEIRYWNGEWKNPAGDVLVYALSYRRPEGSGRPFSQMSVMAVHIPREAAEKAQSQVDKF